MNDPSRRPTEPTCPVPFEDDVLKEVISYEGSTCLRLVDNPTQLEYPTTPSRITCDPNDPERKYLWYPILPDEPQKSNNDTTQKDGK